MRARLKEINRNAIAQQMFSRRQSRNACTDDGNMIHAQIANLIRSPPAR
jgi:hypothetical protein